MAVEAVSTPTDGELATLSIHAMAEAERRGEDLEGQLVASHRAIYEAGRSEASGAWIPCETRMPVSEDGAAFSRSRAVLFVVAFEPGGPGRGMSLGYYDHEKELWIDTETDGMNDAIEWSTGQVTHWRELPALPGAPHE